MNVLADEQHERPRGNLRIVHDASGDAVVDLVVELLGELDRHPEYTFVELNGIHFPHLFVIPDDLRSHL